MVDVVLMDLSKAFDAIPYCLLLTKLYTYGISRDDCKMIRSFLINMRQGVKLDDIRSSWTCAVRGLPRASQAGPHVCNIFLNDFVYFFEGLCQTTD